MVGVRHHSFTEICQNLYHDDTGLTQTVSTVLLWYHDDTGILLAKILDILQHQILPTNIKLVRYCFVWNWYHLVLLNVFRPSYGAFFFGYIPSLTRKCKTYLKTCQWQILEFFCRFHQITQIFMSEAGAYPSGAHYCALSYLYAPGLTCKLKTNLKKL